MLEIKNLTKIYQPKKGVGVKALDNVSIDFGESGLVFLLGKSGSGKSTLLNMIGGIDSQTSGEIFISGQSSSFFKDTDYDSYRNTCVGFVFQEYNLIENYTVSENIGIALELQGKTAQSSEIESILRKVELVDEQGETLMGRKINELSGGQKQRVAIARALIKNPQIILADEPTGALDSETGQQLYELLKTLAKDKLIIVVTHDRENAEKYGERIVELKDGKIITDVQHQSVDACPLKDDSTSFNLVKSKLPLKRSLKMGASGLKVKKFRLIVSMLLSVVTFFVFGFSITAAFADENRTVVKKMYEHNHSMLIIESDNREGIREYHENGAYSTHMYGRPLTDRQLDIIKKNNNNKEPMWAMSAYSGQFGNEFQSYDLSYWNNFFAEPTEGRFYNLGRRNSDVLELDPISGVSDANLKVDSRFINKDLCGLPQEFNEVAITDITAEMFIRFGYKTEDGTKIEIKTPDDLIGLMVGDFKIVGVYSTEIDISEMEKYFLEANDYEEEFLTNLYMGIRRSIASYNFVKKGFFLDGASGFKPFNVLVKLSGNLRADRNMLRDLKRLEINLDRTDLTDVVLEQNVAVGAMYTWLVSAATHYNSIIIPVGLIGSAVFSVFATLLIMFFLNVSFDFRKKEIGILRALGARKKDVVMICLIEASVIMLINLFISVIAVAVVCSIINAMFYVRVFIFGPLQILLLFLLVFGVTALATIMPLVKLTNKKPIDIINNK